MQSSAPKETHRLAPMRGLHLNRIESLTDGVFAIAMTILIFDLKSTASGHGDSGALVAYLNSIIGNFIIYVISFFLLGLFWFYYHTQLHRIVNIQYRSAQLSVLIRIRRSPSKSYDIPVNCCSPR
jgi:uncharacterized membrane protein